MPGPSATVPGLSRLRRGPLAPAVRGADLAVAAGPRARADPRTTGRPPCTTPITSPRACVISARAGLGVRRALNALISLVVGRPGAAAACAFSGARAPQQRPAHHPRPRAARGRPPLPGGAPGAHGLVAQPRRRGLGRAHALPPRRARPRLAGDRPRARRAIAPTSAASLAHGGFFDLPPARPSRPAGWPTPPGVPHRRIVLWAGAGRARRSARPLHDRGGRHCHRRRAARATLRRLRRGPPAPGRASDIATCSAGPTPPRQRAARRATHHGGAPPPGQRLVHSHRRAPPSRAIVRDPQGIL